MAQLWLSSSRGVGERSCCVFATRGNALSRFTAVQQRATTAIPKDSPGVLLRTVHGREGFGACALQRRSCCESFVCKQDQKRVCGEVDRFERERGFFLRARRHRSDCCVGASQGSPTEPQPAALAQIQLSLILVSQSGVAQAFNPVTPSLFPNTKHTHTRA